MRIIPQLGHVPLAIFLDVQQKDLNDHYPRSRRRHWQRTHQTSRGEEQPFRLVARNPKPLQARPKHSRPIPDRDRPFAPSRAQALCIYSLVSSTESPNSGSTCSQRVMSKHTPSLTKLLRQPLLYNEYSLSSTKAPRSSMVKMCEPASISQPQVKHRVASLARVNDSVPHSFTYTPDAAQSLVQLAERATAWNQTWHVPATPNPLTGKEFVALAAKEMGVEPKYRVLSRPILRIAGWFDPLVAESYEMLYQSDSPYVFDSSKFAREFGFAGTRTLTASEPRPPPSSDQVFCNTAG